MYDPSIGRWITEDPVGFDAGDMDLYRYIGNNPTNEVDPSGEAPSLKYPASGKLQGTNEQQKLYKYIIMEIDKYNFNTYKFVLRRVNTGDERKDKETNDKIEFQYGQALDKYTKELEKVWNDFIDKSSKCTDADAQKKLWMEWEKNYPIIAGRMWAATLVTMLQDNIITLPKEEGKLAEVLKRIVKSVEDLKIGIGKEKGQWKTEVEGTIIIVTVQFGGGKWSVKWGKEE